MEKLFKQNYSHTQLIDEYGLPKADDAELFNGKPEQTRTVTYSTGNRRRLLGAEVAATEEIGVTAESD
ncbi:MAG: hypothetical protein K2K70_12715 [Lachnospiraceae bacterium]|nr:hypothetical protein [Lachnospiraceae bacterium]